MLKIRLMRIGTNKRPFYRVVAVDERSKRTGGYIELLGTYNPLTEPHEIKLKQDRIDDWIKKGAQMSDGFLRIIGKAPQRPPRKPKKEKAPEAPKPEPKAEAETPTEEASQETDSGVADAPQNDSAEQPRPEADQPVAGATETDSGVADAPQNDSEEQPEVTEQTETAEEKPEEAAAETDSGVADAPQNDNIEKPTEEAPAVEIIDEGQPSEEATTEDKKE